MKSYMYQDEHASTHVVNVHSTYKHNIAYNVTYKIGGKVGRELSSIVEQLGGYTVCLKVSIAKLSKLMEQKTLLMVAIVYIAGKC